MAWIDTMSLAWIEGFDTPRFVPEHEAEKYDELRAMRGYGYILAALLDGEVVGYVDVKGLGYCNVEAWKAK
jgi:hypothetical protein